MPEWLANADDLARGDLAESGRISLLKSPLIKSWVIQALSGLCGWHREAGVIIMKQTDRSLLEQMRMSDFEVEYRKSLFTITDEDVGILLESKSVIELHIDGLVTEFYEMQTSTPEIALLIGDADTLSRLRSAQRQYVLDLFSGVYDLDYVHNRLRIGLVHKRIGVEPKLYLSAIYSLKHLLQTYLRTKLGSDDLYFKTLAALEKLFMFDIALVFDTYIRSLVSEIEASREKSERYALSLEEKVRERTEQLEELSRTDPLTGLLNSRHMNELLTIIANSGATAGKLDANEPTDKGLFSNRTPKTRSMMRAESLISTRWLAQSRK